MADVLTVQDLEAAKKHDTFHSEVITGRAGGSASGAEIDAATNAVTGQVQATLPKVIRDVGFKPASFNFVTGGTLGVSDADKCIYNPAPAGDDNWYSWSGALPHDVGPGTDPTLPGSGYVPRTDVTIRYELAAQGGDNLIGFLQSGDDASPRTVHDKLAEVEYSPEDFGAIGDLIADDSDALDACLAAGVKICLYKNYRRTRPLAIVGGKNIRAATPWVGRIYFDNCDAGTHTLVNRNDQAVWDGVSLLAISKGTKVGLIATGNGLTNRLRPFIFRNCNFSGADLLQPDTIWPGESTANIQEWKEDLRIKSAAFSLIESCALTGKSTSTSSGWDTGTTGVIVESSSYVSILNSKIIFKKFGYALVGSTEGFADINNQIVDCYDGGTNQQHGGTIGPANNWVVQGGHCDCSHRGLDFGLHNDGSMGGLHTISGRLFLKRESGGISGYAAISLTVSRSTVYGNVIQTNGATSDYVAMGDSGIRIAGIENDIFGNVGRNCGTLIDLVAGSVQNIATNNRLSKSGTATSRLHNDAGTQNVLAMNSYNSGSGAHRGFTATNQLWGAGASYNVDVKTSGLAPNYDTRFDFTGGSAVDAGGTLVIRVAKLSTTAADTNVNTIRPNVADTYTCGTASIPWSGGFTQAAFTVTSDERMKTAPLEITEAMLDAAAEVDWVQYQYLDRVEAKGSDGARWHFGAVAQRYVEAFARHGLDAHDYGFLCYDEWGASDAVTDEETGDTITPAIEAGNRYGIRYEEALALEAALQRRNYQRLLARVEAIESK